MPIEIYQRGERPVDAEPSRFEVRTVKCAVCSREKKEGNHWFVLEVVEGAFLAEALPTDRALLIGEEPVCGQSCAQKKFEKYLQTRAI